VRVPCYHWSVNLGCLLILITYCNTLLHTATHCNTRRHTATHCNTLQHTATHCNTLSLTCQSRVPSYRYRPILFGMALFACGLIDYLLYSTILCIRYYTLHHTATHCNTLQHTATHTDCGLIDHLLYSTVLCIRNVVLGRVSPFRALFLACFLEHPRSVSRPLSYMALSCVGMMVCLFESRAPLLWVLCHYTGSTRPDWSRTDCNTLQHTATHCNTLQHTATHTEVDLSARPASLFRVICVLPIFVFGWVSCTRHALSLFLAVLLR